MPTFGLIVEGKTDFPVIRNILRGWFDGASVTRIQPEHDDDPAGWLQVFAALKMGKHREALGFNDFVVVHVDTDVCQEKGFDVPVREEGRALTDEEVLQAVCARVKDLLGKQFLEAHGGRVILAVAVNALECWLMPLFFENNKRGKTSGCLAAINHARHLANKEALSSGDETQKFIKQYEDASRPYLKRKVLLESGPDNLSLAHFLFQLTLACPVA